MNDDPCSSCDRPHSPERGGKASERGDGGMSTENITQDELAEALDSEQFGLNSSWVGGRELAVNVFDYFREHRESPPAPVELSDGDCDRLWRMLSDPAADGQLAALDRAVERMRAAEGKLAEIAAYVREHKGDEGFSWVHALDILHIIGSNEEVCPGGC